MSKQNTLTVTHEAKIEKSVMFASYPDVVDVDALCEMLGNISNKLAYRLIHEKKIHSIMIGREYKISKQFVIDYLLGPQG